MIWFSVLLHTRERETDRQTDQNAECGAELGEQHPEHNRKGASAKSSGRAEVVLKTPGTHHLLCLNFFTPVKTGHNKAPSSSTAYDSTLNLVCFVQIRLGHLEWWSLTLGVTHPGSRPSGPNPALRRLQPWLASWLMKDPEPETTQHPDPWPTETC